MRQSAQLLDYPHSIYRQQTIPIPVIPIVFYHGQPKWKIPLSFTEQFMKRLRTPEVRIEERIIELLSGHLPNFSCHLYDLSRQRYEQVGLAPGLEVSLLAMRHYWDLENVEFLRKLEIGLERLLKEDRKLFKNIVAYLAKGGKKRLELLKKHISSREVLENMDMVELLAEERRMEGIAEGEAKGIEKGREEGMEKAARSLHSHGMAKREIARNLELPLGQVERYLSRQQ